jgi:HEAT repeat protein
MIRPAAFVVGLAATASLSGPAAARQSVAIPPARAENTADQVRTAIDTLGSLEFPVRTAAARTIRRASSAIAVPALTRAVTSHTDEFVRFRALVVLSGFNDPRTRDLMLKMIADRNDRIRAGAYSWFEQHPDPVVLPRLLQALDREESEFVRPSLTSALSAYGTDPKVRELLTQLVMKGHDLFRSAVIEALGDHKAAYALKPIAEVAKLDGPLQDDAVLAIGRLGDKRGLETLAALQRTAPRTLQPTIAAAICLLGSNCSSHQGFIVQTLKFATENPGFQPLLRAAAGALGALAFAGSSEAVDVLIARGVPSRDPERAPIALALGTVAIRNTPLLLKTLETRPDAAPAIDLLRDAFDMLEEDLEEERFFALVRRTYWDAAEGSPTRRVAEMLIQRLEF